jgi:hypothetical protein
VLRARPQFQADVPGRCSRPMFQPSLPR